MRYIVRHITRYDYAEPVSQCFNLAHMAPRNTARQACLGSRCEVDPIPAYSRQYADYFGNTAYHFSIQAPHEALSVLVESEVEVRACPLVDPGISCEEALKLLHSSAEHECLLAREFVLKSPLVLPAAALRDYAALSFGPNRSLLGAVAELTGRIFEDFAFDPTFTSVATPLQEVFEHRRGVCQDFAHLAIACLRSLGLPARYMSGYLETLPPPGMEKLVGADASHAWFSIYVPGHGWFDYDPTNNQMANAQYITCAWGRDYSDVPPLAGVIYGGGEEQALSVSVDVSRVAQ